MFEVGFTEIILILGLALLVLGPEKLPGLAQKIGRWTGRARSMARQLRTQLEHEVTMDELARSRPMQPPPATSTTAPSSTAAATATTAPIPPAGEPMASAPTDVDGVPVSPAAAAEPTPGSPTTNAAQ